MKKLILIGGDLASGKSTFSKIIKEKFSLFVVNKDSLKEILGDFIVTKNREENKKLSNISFQIMCYLLHCNTKTIVLESNFKSYEMESIRQICMDEQYQVLSLKFYGDYALLQKRFINRFSTRHKVHQSQDFSSLDCFIAAQNELRDVSYPGKVLSICCDDFSYQSDESIFQEIEVFLSDECEAKP